MAAGPTVETPIREYAIYIFSASIYRLGTCSISKSRGAQRSAPHAFSDAAKLEVDREGSLDGCVSDAAAEGQREVCFVFLFLDIKALIGGTY